MNTGKRKFSNRILSVVLVLLLVFSMVPANVLSAAAMSQGVETADEIGTTDKTEQSTEEAKEQAENTTKDETSESESSDKPAESTTDTSQTTENAITIVVKDVRDNPLSGANVTVGLETKTTDSNGAVVFGSVKDGEYTVRAAKDGYEEKTKAIVVASDMHSFKIILQSEAVEPAKIEFKAKVTVDGHVKNDDIKSVTVNGKEAALDNNGIFTATLTTGEEYKVVVTPKDEKAFDKIEKTFTASEEFGSEFTSYNLVTKTYLVTVNGANKGSYKYGAEFVYDVSRTGYEVDVIKVTEGGSDVAYEEDGSTISFKVYGDTNVSVTYQYEANFTVGKNGTVIVDGKEDNFNVTKKDGEEVSYQVKADPGYYIKALTVDGNRTEYSKNTKDITGTVKAKSTISVEFAEITYNVTISIKNSSGKKGSASLFKGESKLISLTDSGEIGSVNGSVTVNKENFDGEKYTLALNTEVKNRYILKYSVGGQEIKEVKNNKVDIVITSDISLTFFVVPVEYKLTYVDPLNKQDDKDNPWNVFKFTVESGEIELPKRNAEGYTFIGWSKDVPNKLDKDAQGLLNGKYEAKAFTDDTVLYAVYTINAAKVEAESEVTYSGEKIKADYTVDDGKVNENISEAWFGNDVTLKLKSLKDIVYDVKTFEGEDKDGQPKEVKDNNFVLKTVPGSNRTVAVSVGGSISHKCAVGKEAVELIYAAEKSDFTVNIDAKAPTLDVTNNEAKDVMTANDEDSKIEAVEYAVISSNTSLYKDILRNENITENDFGYVEELKTQLRKENWIKLEQSADGKYVSPYALTDDTYAVYRARDKAGNDVYSSFDLTLPAIKNVECNFIDNSGNVYVNRDGNITFKVTIEDRRLFYIDQSNPDYKYDGCKLTIYEKDNENNKKVFSAAESFEKWSPFKDKWEADFVVKADEIEQFLDKELKFCVAAEDQAHNKAESYTGSGIVFVETEKPSINVEYEALSAEKSYNCACATGETIYSTGDVIASIEAGKVNFDPYCNSSDSKANVTVKVDGEPVSNVEWSKENDKWLANVTISGEGEHKVVVETASHSGNTYSYTSGKIVIDETAPEIKIEFSNANGVFENGNASFNNGNDDTLKAAITVTDNYLYPIDESSNTSALVRLNGNELENIEWNKGAEEWTATVELPTDEGEYKLAVEATDHSGNVKEETKAFCNDNTAPTATAVSIAYKEGNNFLNKLTFGNFFNDKVEVTVSATDGSESYCSGVKSIELLFDGEVIADKVATNLEADNNAAVTAVFEIPEKDLESLQNGWESNLSVKVTDNVENASTIGISEAQENNGIQSDRVLYEKDAPTSSISFAGYKADEKEYVLKDENIKINITDEFEGKLSSGINKVKITVGENSITDDYSKHEKAVFNSNEYTIGYDEETFDGDLYLSAGENKILVEASDNAGNSYRETYTVYKDVSVPTIDSIDITASENSDSTVRRILNKLTFGIFFSDKVVVTVKCSDGDSGVNKVELIYDGAAHVMESSNGIYTYKLPTEDKKDVDWESALSVCATDNVGNVSESVSAKDINDNDDIQSDKVLYEKNKPASTIDFEKYVADSREYVLKDKSITINVTDEVKDEHGNVIKDKLASGLNNVKVFVGEKELISDDLSAGEEAVNSRYDYYKIGYDDLSAGKNKVTVYVEDNAGNSQETEYTVYKDITEPVVTYGTDVFHYDYRNENNSKLWLKDGKEITIGVADAAFEDDVDSQLTSGLAEATVTVEGVQSEGTVVTNQTYNNITGDFKIIYDDLTPGENIITITATDNIGNYVEETITVYKDVSIPSVDNIDITVPENADSTARRILNKLTFGIFFNTNVEVKLICSDKDPSSGIAEVQLTYDDGKNIFVGKSLGEDVYTFELPNSKTAKQWTAELSAIVIDNVDNTSDPKNIKDISETDDIRSDRVLYEKKAPSITFDYSDYINEGENNNLYYDAQTKTYWMTKNKNVKIVVDDNKADEKGNKIEDKFISGLNNVTVKISGTVEDKKAETILKADDFSKDYTSSNTYTVKYNDLYEGKNVITVKAEDNAGNVSEKIENNKGEETTVVIWKDSNNPTVKGIKVYRIGEDESIMENDAGEKLSVTRRTYGNFYNGTVKIAVSVLDEKFSSGIKSLALSYVYTDENGKSCKIKGKMVAEEKEDKADKKDDKEQAEKDSVLEYADKKEDVTSERIFTLEPPMQKDKDGNNVLIDSEGYLEIKVVDNTGNSYTFDNNSSPDAGEDESNAWPLETKGEEAKSNILVNYLMFEDNKATFESSLSEAEHSCKNKDDSQNEHLWYKNTDIDFSVTVRDIYNKEKGQLNSGLRTVKIVVENSKGTHEALRATLGADAEPVYEETFKINLKDCGAVEGTNTIIVSCSDNALNTSTHKVTVYVDQTKPVVDYFSFKGINGTRELSYEECKTVKKTDYGYYFSKDTEVTVHVSDKNPSSGIKKVYFVAIPAENAKPSTKLDTSKSLVTPCCVTSEEGLYSTEATFKVKANFKGQIYAYVEDNTGYNSLDKTKKGYDQWVRPDGLIVETQALHNQMSEHIKIDILSTPVTYLNGSKNPLFSDNVKLRLSVDDSYSGIREVSYRVVAGHDTGKNFEEKLIVKNGTGSWKSKGDLNLTTFLSKEITVSNNSNDIKIYLSMVDNSGNVTTNENNPLVISIDKDAPEISVSYTPDDGGDDAEFIGFFKTDRTMTVKVKERNFSSDLVKITSTADNRPYSIAPKFGKGTEVVENGIQYFVYTMTYVFHNDADYTFAIAASDKAKNQTDDNAVNYGSASAKTVAKKFTVDQTLPEITVNISGQKGKDIYYKGDVTVEITVVEHNYTEGRYNAVFSMKNPQSGVTEKVSMPTPSISGSGDVWHHTYVFTGEYMSKLESIKVVDMAGNEKDSYNGSYAGEDFVVDKTDPSIQFYTDSEMQKTLDKTATKSKTVTPYILIKDTNLDAYDESDYDIQLKGNYNGPYLSGKEDYTFSFIRDSSDPTVLAIGFNGFANKENVDDIYTLTVSAVDKAGCSTTETVVFSVNRYGSTFMVSEKTEQILSKYYTNNPQDIDIVQINAAEINSQRVSLTKNGIASDLTEGVDYTVTSKAPGSKNNAEKNNTDSNWYECTYKINKQTFEDEGIYSVTVYSKDSANSVLTSATSKRTIYLFKDKARSDNAVVVDEKDLEAPVNFQVDKTKPTASINGLEQEQYFTGSKEFTVTAGDDVLLDYIVLSIDGKKTKYTAEEVQAGKTCKLDKNNDYQFIQVEAHDVAGNVFTSEIKKVQVTTNLYEWFIRNTIAQIVAGMVVLILLVVLIIILRRRKLRDAQ